MLWTEHGSTYASSSPLFFFFIHFHFQFCKVILLPSCCIVHSACTYGVRDRGLSRFMTESRFFFLFRQWWRSSNSNDGTMMAISSFHVSSRSLLPAWGWGCSWLMSLLCGSHLMRKIHCWTLCRTYYTEPCGGECDTFLNMSILQGE